MGALVRGARALANPSAEPLPRERCVCASLRRRPVLTLAPAVWQLPCALAPNFGTIVVARFLGGISSAGGSVTLGMGTYLFVRVSAHY